MMENLKEHKKVGFCGAILILRRLWILKLPKEEEQKKVYYTSSGCGWVDYDLRWRPLLAVLQ
ncbi:unnamed protein product [Musa hybrid cultivar]